MGTEVGYGANGSGCVDRASGRADCDDGSEDELSCRHLADGIGAVEVFGTELLEGEDREGREALVSYAVLVL